MIPIIRNVTTLLTMMIMKIKKNSNTLVMIIARGGREKKDVEKWLRSWGTLALSKGEGEGQNAERIDEPV